jgi:winged helix-turn-helix DNA-binding protein
MTVLDDLQKLEASIVKRYQELQPALAEVEELRRVAERLGVNLDRASTKAAKPAKAATRTRGRRGASKGRKAKAASGAPRRPRAGGRREQVLQLVTDRPGITVAEIGKALKIDPTGLYRYAKQLEADGVITKTGTKLSLADS